MADHVVRDAPKLKWIQALGTGVDNIVDLPSLGKEVVVTNVRGIHGAPVSEATIAYMLSLARDMPRSVHAQDRSAWERWPSQLLAGKTVGILGVGLIAEYLAPICKAFGMTVIGISGSPRPRRVSTAWSARDDLMQGRAGARLSGGAGPADAGDARHRRRKAARRHEADRLSRQCRARRRGRRAGADQGARSRPHRRRRARRVLGRAAAADNPLWKTKNVTIFPHLGGYSQGYEDRAMPTIAGNMQKFLAAISKA